MDGPTKPSDPRPPEPDPEPLSVRLLWPELDDGGGIIDHESALIAERRAKVFRAYTRGRTVREIEAEVGCSKSTAATDVRFVRDSFRRIALQDAAAHVARELARLAVQEAEAWEAWDRSKSEAVETNTERGDGKAPYQKARMKKRHRDGDPRFLDLVNKFWAQRCRLLGLLKDGDLKANALPPTKLVAGLVPEDVV